MSTYRIIERPTGKGKIFQNGVHIGDVQYSIEVGQDYIAAATRDGGVDDIAGRKTITGQITIIGGQRLQTDGILLLHLEDGRFWEFWCQDNLNPMSSIYKAVNASEKGVFLNP